MMLSSLSVAAMVWLAVAPEPPPDPAPTRTEAPTPVPQPEAAALGPSIDALPEPSPVLEEALAPHTGGLTAETVATKAVANAPTIAAKHAELEVAAAKVDQTLVAFVPQVKLTAGYTRLSDVDVQFGSGALVGAGNAGLLGVGPCPGGAPGQCVVDSMGAPVGAAQFNIPQVLNQFSTQAMISVPISDYVLRVFRGLSAARKSKKASEHAEAAERAKVAADARIAYYNWVRGVAQVAVTRDAYETAEARLTDARVSHRVGYLTNADLLRIEALVASAEAAIVEAEAFEELARENLSVIMDEPVREWEIGQDVLSGKGRSDRAKMHEMVSEALSNRNELKALSTNVGALDDGIRTARAGYYPRLDAFGEVTYANPNQRYFPPTDEWNATGSVGVQLTWTLNAALAARTDIKELRAQKRGLSANYELLQRGIRLEVTSAYVDRRRAMSAISVAQKNREASEAGYTAVSAQFKVGKATATDVIEAQGERLTAQLRDVNARIDLEVAEVKLDYAAGLSG